ncbi:MAG: hypothetical protein LUD16_13430 [Lachnospiraceae bacterium]|nr:hypothetical protein [Lachnospiraceae bacterium]
MSKRKKAGGRKQLTEEHLEVQVESVNDKQIETDNEILTETFPEKEVTNDSDEIAPEKDAVGEDEQDDLKVEFAAFEESVIEKNEPIIGENGAGQKSGNHLCQWRQWLTGLLLMIFAVVYLLNNGSKNAGTSLPQGTETVTTESEFETAVTAQTVQVTGTSETDGLDISTAGADGTTTEENQGGTDNQDGIASETENASGTREWQKTIFGEAENTVLSSIKVSGLTEEQKEKSGYRESDFLTALSAFLTDNGLAGVTEVIFENELSCSSDGAVAYSAKLDNSESRIVIIMYPDYPGQYILLLEETMNAAEESELVEELETQTESEANERAQEAIEIQNGQNSSETGRKYDATTLSVTEIPITLLNYLSNRYELQYTLYDYLYRNGYSDVTAVAVSSYEIDADTRTATITFTLSDGSSLTGIYSRDDNSYSYQ